jgi:tRNA(Glu) U13 pseudouridine synthase TruD
MFVHAVQSFIFNEALSRILIENAIKNSIEYYIIPYSAGNFVFYKKHTDYEGLTDVLELTGFNTLNMNHNIKKILNELSLTQRDFIVRALPDLSVEGTTRECFAEVRNFEKRILDDRVILEFELNKGSYATIVVKMLFNG